MSVPSSAYDTKIFSDLTQGQDYKWAKLLSEYGGWAGVKEKFYLDEVLEGNEGGVTFFIGSCIPGSPNSLYHKTSRLKEVFWELRLYDDGGLHTYGHGEVIAILSSDAPNKDANLENYPPRINNTTIFCYFLSAYYLQSTAIKIEMRDEYSPGIYVEVQNFGSLAAAANSSPRSNVVSQLTKSGTHWFRVTVTNSEGTRVFDEVEIDIRMSIFSFTYDSLFASDAVTGSSVTRYGNTRELLDAQDNGTEATQLFTDETSNPLVHTANGYYVVGNMWYQYGYDTLADRYAILTKGQTQPGGYPSGDPGNIVQDAVIEDVNGFSAFDWETAETQVLSGNYVTTPLYLEHNFETGVTKVYTDSGFSQLAQAGYYVQGTWQLQNLDRYIQVGDSGVLVYDEPTKP